MLIPDKVELGQLLYCMSKYSIATQNNSLKEYNITLQQSLIMIYLYKNPEQKVTQRLLEEKMDVSNPTMTNIIKVMVNNNLIYKIQDKKDGRKYYLYLTPKALELAPKCIERIDETDSKIWKNISETEIKTVINILKKVKNY